MLKSVCQKRWELTGFGALLLSQKERKLAFGLGRSGQTLICLHLCTKFCFVLFLERQLYMEYNVGKD